MGLEYISCKLILIPDSILGQSNVPGFPYF